MPTFPPLAPALVPRDSMLSYLPRLAATKGVSTADLCYDMKAACRRVLNFEDEPLAAVAEFWWTIVGAD
ncbi:TniQ family protein [Martelella soudanensis]|uniref:hypothetical protein n=2 Tax=unclassified Martelella TaxID=2629616 RepID=UPI001AED53A7|nr:hypothetical protein [Martelella sp. NC18]